MIFFMRNLIASIIHPHGYLYIELLTLKGNLKSPVFIRGSTKHDWSLYGKSYITYVHQKVKSGSRNYIL
jgi:hypothetical protein